MRPTWPQGNRKKVSRGKNDGMLESWSKTHNFSGLFTRLPRRLMPWLYQELLEKLIMPKLLIRVSRAMAGRSHEPYYFSTRWITNGPNIPSFGLGSNIGHGLFVGWVEHPDIFCWVSFLYPTYLPAIFVLSAKPNKMAEDRIIPPIFHCSIVPLFQL